MGFWDKYEEDRKKKEEEQKAEEEKAIAEQKKEDRARDSLSFWEQMEYDKLTGNRSPAAPKDEEVAALTEPDKLIGKLADRGVTIQLPEPEKEPVIDERPTLAEAVEQGRKPALFTDRLGNTSSAKQAQENAIAKLMEEQRKNETVRNQEWLDSLRSPEEIQAELDEAEKDLKARQGQRRGYLETALAGNLLNTDADMENYMSYVAGQTGEKEASDRVKALTDELAERKWADYERLRNNEDFAEKSQYDDRDKEGRTNRATGVTVFDDPLYEYINGNELARLNLAQKRNMGATQNPQYETALQANAQEYTQYAQLTDDERAMYNYLHATQNKEAANEYLAYLMSGLYARQAEEEKARAADWADNNALNATLATVGSIAASPLRGAAYLGQTAEYLTSGKIDENAPYNRIAYLPKAARESVSNEIERNWGKVGTFAYGVGVSMAEFLLNNAVSGGAEALSLALMGTGAAADATIEAKERGLSDNQSYALGTIAGLAEIATEKISIENLFNGKWDTEPLRYLFKNTLAEGSEEAGSDLINWFADVLIARDKSEWKQAINKYMTVDHMNERDAFIAALKDKGLEILLDAGSGALSGFLMAAGPTAKGLAQRSADRSADIEATRAAVNAVKNLGQEKPNVMAGIKQAQQQAAQPEGIVLPTAEEAARTEEKGSGNTLRFGTEPETKTLTPTVEEAETNAAVEKAEAEGNLTRATGIRYGIDEKTIQWAERMSQATGHRILFYVGQARRGGVENGFTKQSTGDIYLNKNAKKKFEFTFGHEFTHNLEGTEAYDRLMDYAKSRATEQGMDWFRRREDMGAMYEEAEGRQLPVEYIDQEILADWIGQNLSDEKTIREICRENPSAAKRIRDALDSFIIRAANAGGIMTDYEARKYKNVVGMIERYIGEAGRDLEQTASENAQEAQENAQITPENAHIAPENAQASVIPAETSAAEVNANETPGQYLMRMQDLYADGQISEEDLAAAEDLAAEMESTGRGIASSTVEREEGPRGKIAEAVDRIAGKRYSLTEADDSQRKENAKKAVEYFGRTYSWNETGYITQNGDRIDFSGRHEGMRGGRRTVDHRDIIDALGDDYGGDNYSDGMVRFMGEGNIRISPESGGINIGPVEPTAQQYLRLTDFIQKNRGEVIVDLDDAQGRTISSVEYPSGTRSSKVLDSIRDYFRDGTLPEEPEIRYSLAEDPEQADADYMEAVEAGDTEAAQRMVDEAAERAGYTRRMWHGAKNGKTFTTFRGWSYFTEDRAFAEKYTNRDPENLYGVYAKVDHPFDTRTDRKARRIFEKARREHGFTQLGDSGLPDWTDGYDLADYIDENELDYDGILLDEGEQYVPNARGELEPRGRVVSYVIRDSAQVKSADPVTYDDDGEPIKLSERFNDQDPDIRWSLSEDKAKQNDIRYSIDAGWENAVDKWDKAGRPSTETFTVGRTSDSLRSIGVEDRSITWTGKKIKKIFKKHPAMTLDVVKQVPNVIENPILVLKSRTVDGRITAFGEVYDTKGIPVLAALDLQPESGGCEIEDVITINSAYGKDHDLRDFILNSDVLYVDPDVKRTDSWLKSVRLQLPSAQTNIGPIGSITYPDGKVNISGEKAENIFETENSTEEDAEQIDRDYAEAVESGDIETAQRLVDEAARDAGYTIKVYHGTPQETISAARGKVTGEDYQILQTDYADKLFPFVVFKGDGRLTGIYTATDRGIAETFSFNFSDTGTVYDLYAKADNPLRFDALGSGWNSIPGNLLSEYGMGMPGRISLDDVARYAKENGYDAVIADNVRETGSGDEGSPVTTDVIVFDPSQVKSADPEVYDDAGELIPLSERFNDQSDDIRYSMSEEEKRIGENPADDTDSYYFKQWFGDWQNDPENASKVVNPDGTPKRMYHGTNADREFTMFNTYGANYGLYGAGSYFTDNPEVAQGYTHKGRGKNPRVYQVYLNIRNPIVMEQEADVDRWLNALPELVDYITVPGDSELAAVTNRDFYRAMEEYFADQGLTKWEAAEDAMDTLKAMGYDGINHVGGMNKDIQHDVWIAFDPEQIKSATDNIGTYDTEDPDIRYSLDENQNDQNDLAGLSQKAKSAALRIERQLTMDVAQAIQRDLKPDPKDPEFRQFRAEVARPVIEQMLRGEQADVDAVLESTGIDIVGQAAARGAVNDALRRASGEIGRIRTAVQQSNARQQAREARNAEIDARIPGTTAELVDLANTVKAARNRWNSIRGRTMMTDEDMALAHQIATGQITEGEAFAQNAFGMDDIVNMAEAEREFLDANVPWERYTKRLMQGRFEEADGYLQNADQAKDKASGFQYDRETPERNFRDVFGSDAAAMIDKYIRPVHTAEAASTRMKNEYNKRVKDLKLSQKVGRGNTNSEAAAVQYIGEAEDNIRVLELARNYNAMRDGKTLEEWRNDLQAFINANPNLDYNKVRQGIEAFQQIYNELITRMNEVLVENGYMPVNVRRGYFPHFNGGSDGVLATFAHLLGINIDTNALPTAINGLTSMFKPGKPWFSHAMERTGFQTDYDALQGFDGYLSGVSDVIHQTPNIRNLRALNTRIRYMMGDEQIRRRIDEINADDSRSEQEKLAAIQDLTDNGRYKLSRFVAWLDEYTNLLANKKSKLDRGIEDLMGRRFYTWMKNIEGRVAANMISGNLGSALTNFIPLNQAGAVLGEPAMIRGAFDTMAGRARGDGFAERSDFLTNRRGVDPLVMTSAQKISEVLSKPMNLIDDFTSETIVRAAYSRYRKQGLDEQSAMQAADELAAGLMADRSKGAQPTIFGSHNPLLKLFTQFQVEVNNEFSTIFKDIPKGTYLPPDKKKNLVAYAAWTLLRYFVGAYLFNDLYEKIVGRRAALDPLDLLNDAVGDFTGKKLNNVFDMISEGVIDQDKPKNPSEAIMNFGKNSLEELPFVGGVLGGGRIPISSALPDAETIVKGLANENWDSAKKAETIGRELGKTIGTYWLPPFAGGAIKKGVETAENAIRGGRYVKDAEGNDQLQYPYFSDTLGEQIGTIATSALFGPTATEGGKEWVEGGFGNQSAKKTALYKELTEDLGESQHAAWDLLNAARGSDKYNAMAAVANADLSDEGKALALKTLIQGNNGAKFEAANSAEGVTADVWYSFWSTLPEFDSDNNNSFTQAEVAAALERVEVPLSSGEGMTQGLFGGSTETRKLTNSEKAALWSAYNPKWKAANNPFDPAVGERVVNRYNSEEDE